MKYTPKEITENVNVSKTSPINEFFLLLGGILGICLIVYIVLGFAVDFIAPKLPIEIERKIGAYYSKFYEDEERTVADKKLQELLDSLVKELPEDKKAYKVHIVKSSKDMINALALPGGDIIVFSALLQDMRSENELAFILAHELGHYANNDHLKGLGRNLVLATMSIGLFGQDNAVTDFLMNSMIKVEMKFSQKQERAADLWALDLLNKKYGHAAGATDFLSRMSKREWRNRFLYFFSTHPYPQDRVDAIEEKIQNLGYSVLEKIPKDEVFEDLGDVKVFSF